MKSQSLARVRFFRGLVSTYLMTSNKAMDRMNRQNRTQLFQSNHHNMAANTTQNRQMPNFSQPKTVLSNTPNANGVRLRPVSDLRQASFTPLLIYAKDSLSGYV